MDYEFVLKLFVAAASIAGAAKIFYEIISGRRSKLREEYKFSKEFLNDIKNNEIHQYSIEKGYHALAGTDSIKAQEVEYILTLENADRCLKDYVLSKKYLDQLVTNGNLQIAFSKKYVKSWPRIWRKFLYGSLYFAFAMAAVSPLLLMQVLNLNVKHVVALFLFSFPISGYLAVDFLREGVKIYRGEMLVKNQKKHTRRIILDK